MSAEVQASTGAGSETPVAGDAAADDAVAAAR